MKAQAEPEPAPGKPGGLEGAQKGKGKGKLVLEANPAGKGKGKGGPMAGGKEAAAAAAGQPASSPAVGLSPGGLLDTFGTRPIDPAKNYFQVTTRLHQAHACNGRATRRHCSTNAATERRRTRKQCIKALQTCDRAQA